MIYPSDANENHVSLEQLKTVYYGNAQRIKRYSRTSNDIPYMQAIVESPQYPKRHPYDFWQVQSELLDTNIFQDFQYDIYEKYAPLIVADWNAFINSAFIQTRPDRFLDYLRCAINAGENPFIELINEGYTNADHINPSRSGWYNHPNNPFSAKAYAWYHRITGERYPVSNEIPAAMLPHTVTENGELDFSITVDRFKERIISYCLFETYTILDISRTTDVDFLEWAYSRVLNRLPLIKSWINDSTTMRTVYENDTRAYNITFSEPLKNLFKLAADDAAVIIRQNIDKLAARTLQVIDYAETNRPVEFIGPEWLNPLSSYSMQNIAPQSFSVEPQNTKSKTPAIIPIVAAVAIGGAVALS